MGMTIFFSCIYTFNLKKKYQLKNQFKVFFNILEYQCFESLILLNLLALAQINRFYYALDEKICFIYIYSKIMMRHPNANNYEQQYSSESQLQVIALRLDNLSDNQLNNHEIPSKLSSQEIPYNGRELFERIFNTGNQNYHRNEKDEDKESSFIRKKIHLKSELKAKKKLQHISTRLDTKQKWHKCKVGKRFQTKNICSYLYNETSKFLKTMAIIHVLTDQMKEEVAKFLQKKSRKNIQGFNQLFSCVQLRQKCLEYYRSNQFVCNIFKSRADVKTKLCIIKYLQKIERMSFNRGIVGWKK